MEAHKVKKDAKSIVLSNGVELTYCELGEQNEEVVISGMVYLINWYNVLEQMATKYHVYGIVMRLSGKTTEFNEDGSVHWSRQWGSDLLNFAKEMGIEKFHYIGSCHGTNPGWYMVKNAPEMLSSFCSYYMTVHYNGQMERLRWNQSLAQGPVQHLRNLISSEEGALRKYEEQKLLSQGPSAVSAEEIGKISEWFFHPELIWDNLDACMDTVQNMEVSVCMMFGTNDILFQDYFDCNIWAMLNIKRVRTILLQGACHLICSDSPDRVAKEAMFFFEESKSAYYH